jgi:hypothetical protein
MPEAKYVNGTRVAIVAASAFVLAGCVVVRPASSSRSLFEGAAYAGETVTISAGSPGNEAFRVYHQGASPFESIQSVRDETRLRAKEYCDHKGNAPEAITETTSVPPYSPGNLPRMEIVFDCVGKPTLAASPTREEPKHIKAAAPTSESPAATKATSSASDEPKFSKLVNLKKLLDSGILTQEEFNREKTKILNEP